MTPLALSIREAANQVGVSDDTIRLAVNKKQLAAKKVGRVIRIKVTDLEEWFDGLEDVAS